METTKILLNKDGIILVQNDFFSATMFMFLRTDDRTQGTGWTWMTNKSSNVNSHKKWFMKSEPLKIYSEHYQGHGGLWPDFIASCALFNIDTLKVHTYFITAV